MIFIPALFASAISISSFSKAITILGGTPNIESAFSNLFTFLLFSSNVL